MVTWIILFLCAVGIALLWASDLHKANPGIRWSLIGLAFLDCLLISQVSRLFS
jgi:hypothetical protein